ncbi:TonB family protein [Sphingomonas qilianensis]|uniref:TonB family protein n=1 Tax=Sphingomonas qilianensis TaxID=1736690 RepID=A0ABU9XR30_9SPHN
MIPAPELPSSDKSSVQPDACKALGEWARELRLTYPANYRRRGIEGGAVVSYDVAPWGAVGNLKVVASEPTSDFGEAATAMLAGAARTSSAIGASGCIDRVRHVMGKPRASLPAEDWPQALH